MESFPGGSVVKNPLANSGDTGSISGSGRSPGEGIHNPLQYSCLRNPMNRGVWRAVIHGVAKESARLSYQTMMTMQLEYCLTCIVWSVFLSPVPMVWFWFQKIGSFWTQGTSNSTSYIENGSWIDFWNVNHCCSPLTTAFGPKGHI